MRADRSTRGRRSPRRYSAEDRERLIREQAESGQTKKAFCAERGIALQTFYGWSKREDLPAKRRFAQVELAAPTQAVVEVLLPNGARIGIHHQGRRDDLVALVRGVAGCGQERHKC